MFVPVVVAPPRVGSLLQLENAVNASPNAMAMVENRCID
jgi:hypothetical protein